MADRMTLRNGKEIVPKESEGEQVLEQEQGIQVDEESRGGSGEFVVQYLEQGRQEAGQGDREGSLTDSLREELDETVRDRRDESVDECRVQEERRREGDVGESGMTQMDMRQIMRMLQQMDHNIRGDMHKMDSNINNIRGDMNKMENNIKGELREELIKMREEIKEEVKIVREEMLQITQGLEEKVEQVRGESENFKRNVQEEISREKAIIRAEIGQEIGSRFVELGTAIKENLPMEINKEVNKQNKEIVREVESVKRQTQDYEEKITIIKNNIKKGLQNLELEMGMHANQAEKGDRVLQGQVEELREKFKNASEEIQRLESNLGQTRVVSTVMPSYNDGGIKFDGNLNYLHPRIFVDIIKNKVKNVRDPIEMKLNIRNMLVGMPLLWFCNNENSINNVQEFEAKFINYFWGENQQASFRERLYFGKFNYEKSTNYNLYAMQLFQTAQYLEPAMREEEIVLYIARQYNHNMAETIALHNIKTMESLTGYLQRIERSVGTQNRNGQEQVTYRNNTANRQGYVNRGNNYREREFERQNRSRDFTNRGENMNNVRRDIGRYNWERRQGNPNNDRENNWRQGNDRGNNWRQNQGNYPQETRNREVYREGNPRYNRGENEERRQVNVVRTEENRGEASVDVEGRNFV
ncbi:unnamed protein product [Diabrotica balteata]|uniref:Uncharacterized protein n=1 Tax=Diabrotica balteata TaxID=107213 RepID=A0A9N9XFN3_DIABA|nr:unnamed protein product [Diabrotica balteata]